MKKYLTKKRLAQAIKEIRLDEGGGYYTWNKKTYASKEWDGWRFHGNFSTPYFEFKPESYEKDNL